MVFEGELHEDGPKRGMVIDFSDVSRIWKERLEPELDHRDLNDSLLVPVTTAEWIACWIGEQMARVFPQLVEVTVWETATSWARWSK